MREGREVAQEGWEEEAVVVAAEMVRVVGEVEDVETARMRWDATLGRTVW